MPVIKKLLDEDSVNRKPSNNQPAEAFLITLSESKNEKLLLTQRWILV